MGKNKIIKSLGKRIGNIALHKVLKKNTNKPESIPRIGKEIIEYRSNASTDFSLHNWNDKELEFIKNKAISTALFILKNYYADVNYKNEEIIKAVEETIAELKEIDE